MKGTTQDVSLSEDVLIPHFGKETQLKGVEIGTSGGTGCIGMLSRLPNLTLYTMDPFKHVDGNLYEAGLSQEIQDKGHELTLNKLSEYPHRVIFFRQTSDEAVHEIPDGLDFVHIDGEHGYEQVVRDIENYLPKIKKGGILSGHDWILQAGVMKAVKERFTDINLAEDFVWWVKV